MSSAVADPPPFGSAKSPRFHSAIAASIASACARSTSRTASSMPALHQTKARLLQ